MEALGDNSASTTKALIICLRKGIDHVEANIADTIRKKHNIEA
jgi:hypothetical protein